MDQNCFGCKMETCTIVSMLWLIVASSVSKKEDCNCKLLSCLHAVIITITLTGLLAWTLILHLQDSKLTLCMSPNIKHNLMVCLIKILVSYPAMSLCPNQYFHAAEVDSMRQLVRFLSMKGALVCFGEDSKTHYSLVSKLTGLFTQLHKWTNQLFSEEKNVLEHYLKLRSWQGPPHINKVKQYKLCCLLSSVCLFSLFTLENNRDMLL